MKNRQRVITLVVLVVIVGCGFLGLTVRFLDRFVGGMIVGIGIGIALAIVLSTTSVEEDKKTDLKDKEER